MTDLIKREDAIRALQCVTDSPNFGKALGEIMRIPSAEQTEPSGYKMKPVEQTEPQTEYKKWETKPTADIPTENTTCVGVAMALVKDEPQTERSE